MTGMSWSRADSRRRGRARAGLAFIERQRGRLTSRHGYAFVIANRADDRAIGAIGVWIRNIDLGRASLGYWLGASARGRGAAAAALLAVSEWALENLEIVRLELFVEEWNVASWRTAERAASFERVCFATGT
jgi:ribosomal-protein-alanine N-acetyltransferase